MTFAFLADECVDQPIVERLRGDEYDVVWVAEMTPGISDDDVLADGNERGALLLTTDKDFGELVYRQQKVTSGVVLIRLAGLSIDAKAEIVSQTLAEHLEDMVGNFCVIAPGSLRVRSP